MRFDKLKLITASTVIFLGSQSAIVFADDSTTSQGTKPAAPSTETPVAAQTQANTAQAPRPANQGYQYPRYNRGYNRGYNRPFGSSGPSFRGPWNKGSGFGFSNNDGPGWGSGPRFGSWDDRDRGYYDRGPGLRGPWDRGRGSGSGFGFSSSDGPDWDPGPGYGPRRGPGYGRWDDRGRGFYDRGPSFRGPWDDNSGSGMGFGW